MIHYFGVTLSDTAGFKDNQVVMGGFEDINGRVYVSGKREIALSGGERAHIHARVVDGVHPDTVAEQGASRFSLGGIYRYNTDIFIREIAQKPAHQFVHHRRFACTTGTCYAEYGGILSVSGEFFKSGGYFRAKQLRIVFCYRYKSGYSAGIFCQIEVAQVFELAINGSPHGEVAFLENVVNHTLQAHGTPVVGVVNTGDTVFVQFPDFFGENGAAAATEYFDMTCAAFFQQIMHVLEELDMAALIAGDGDTLYIFLDGTVHNFLYGAVVAEVNDFGATALHDAAHDINSGIVTVEE